MNILVIADQHEQRHALADTAHKLGADSVMVMDVKGLLNAQALSAEVWFLDMPDELLVSEQVQACIRKHEPKRVLMGFLPAPYLNDDRLFDRWQRSLIRRLRTNLAHFFADVQQTDTPMMTDTGKTDRVSGFFLTDAGISDLDAGRHSWRYVLFLGASMGGPQAVKEILDHLDPSLPVTVVLAHHFDAKMVGSLPRLLTRHNDWQCKIADMSQSLRAGQCLIVPVTRKVICDSTGRMIVTKEPWVGGYQPNIGELLKNLSDAFGNELIGVILSGMGDDGSQYATKLYPNHSRLWAQAPASCVSPSQPQAFIDTGVPTFVGTPKEIADKVSQLLGIHAKFDFGAGASVGKSIFMNLYDHDHFATK